jgi:hypothetical protein
MRIAILAFLSVYAVWNLAVAGGAFWKKKQRAFRMPGVWLRLVFGLGLLYFTIGPSMT